MNEIKSFTQRFAKEHELTISALAESLGYKSKTSLDRLMNANSRENSVRKFEEAMLASFELTTQERERLHRAVRIACEGEEQYQISEKVRALLLTKTPPHRQPVTVRCADTGESLSFAARYRHARTLHATIWNCCQIPTLFSSLRCLMQEKPLRITHYLTESDTQLSAVSALESLVPVLYRPEYEGFIVAQTNSCPPSNRPDLLFMQWADEQGHFHGDIVFFQSPAAGRLLEVDLPTFDRLQSLFVTPPPYTPVKKTYPECRSFEDYIQYSDDIAALECDHSVWKIKPDLCVDLIPPHILEAAIIRGPAGPKDELFFSTLRLLRQVYDRRYQNTFSKKKHCFTLLKKQAMQRFVETGRTTDHFWAMDSFTREERAEILASLLEQQQHNPYVHLLFFRDDDAIRDMEVICYGDEGVMILETDTDYRLEQQTDVMLTHPDIIKLYRDFFTKSLVKEFALPESSTAALFKGWLKKELK